MIWTTERTARMTELINGGLSRGRVASQLTAEFGERVTKNMVVGRLTRAKSPPARRPWPERDIEALLDLKDLGLTNAQIADRLGRTFWAVKSMLERLAVVTTTRTRLKRLRFPEAGRCVWPLWGNDGPPSFEFCDAPVAALGVPYCAAYRRTSLTVARGPFARHLAAMAIVPALR